MIRVPRLKVNRLGVYCLRVVWSDEAGKRREATHSLRTKSPEIARVLALQFNEAYERKRSLRRMSTKKLPPRQNSCRFNRDCPLAPRLLS